MSANTPQPLGTTTIASDLASKQATYLPPSELAIKFAKGIHQHVPAKPHPSATQTGKNPHLIKKIEDFYVRPRWLFVRIETEGGAVGWGEGTLEGHTESVQGSLRDIARRLIGWDAMNIEDIYSFMHRLRFYRGGPTLMSALSGIDIALWDLKGKVLGVPVWELLGGKVRETAPVYGWVGGDRPSDVLEQAKARKAQGFTRVKMNATESLGWLDSPHALDETVQRLAEIKSIGMDAGLDFHGRVHKPMAKQLAKLLEPHRPLFIEEPLLPGYPNEMKDLYNKTSIPIALGERLFTREDFRPYFELGCIDIAQPDIAHSGGISETKKIATMAEAYDIGVAPHCPLGPLAFAACLQIAFCTPNFVVCEMSWKMHYNTDGFDLFTYMLNPEAFAVNNGSVSLLTAPGLGIELNEELIRKEAAEAAKIDPWQNPIFRGPDGSVRECRVYYLAPSCMSIDTRNMPKGLCKDFLYGFATASAQIEGGGKESEEASGRGPSIWDKFCDEGRTADGSHVNRTCNFYGMWKQDIALLKSLGVNAYRFSLSWPRLIPQGGKDDPVNEQGVKFYNDVIDECLAQGITPFVTIYHWDLPLALQEKYKGWTSRDVIPDYVRYAKLCFDRFGDRVKHWITFNEPYVTAVLGHGYGDFAPAHKSNTEPWLAAHTQILAHAQAVDLYRREYKPKQNGVIGITLNGDWSEPWDDSPENVQASQDRLLGFIGWFADPIYLGSYPQVLVDMLGKRLPKFTEEEMKLVKGSSDFYGMNTYTTTITRAGGDDELATKTINGHQLKDGTWIGTESSLKWLRSVPWGLRKLLNWVYKRYQTPIYMTENGFSIKGESQMTKEEALHDKDRVDYYNGYLQSLLEAVDEDGVDVRSYFGWSFLDNFEWASGLGPRFGSVYVDYKTFERTPKDSSKSMVQFFKDNVGK